MDYCGCPCMSVGSISFPAISCRWSTDDLNSVLSSEIYYIACFAPLESSMHCTLRNQPSCLFVTVSSDVSCSVDPVPADGRLFCNLVDSLW